MQRLARLSFWQLFWLAAIPAQAQLVLTEGTNISVDVSRTDGQLATDLLGDIWTFAEKDSEAKRVTQGIAPAKNPRWSPDGRQILYEVAATQHARIRRMDLDSGQSGELSDAQFVDQQPAWHPDGERIVFSSERGDTGFDLWELDLATRLSWRITDQPGDETDPAWSANGRHLAYVHRQAGEWSLMIRRFGEPDEALLVAPEPIFAPSWRPDGSLLTFLQQTPDGLIVQMVILADPPLIRPFMTGEDFFIAPVSWLDRQRFFYTANGRIKVRNFNDWQSKPVHFTAAIESRERLAKTPEVQHPLPVNSPSDEPLVIRTARLFDGSGHEYSYAIDVTIENGRIESLQSRRDRQDEVVLDLGDVTLLPGYIDSYSSIGAGDPAQLGAELLSYGITTIVSKDRPDLDPLLWDSGQDPGPRLLRSAPVTEKPPGSPSTFVVLATVPAGGNVNLVALQAWQALGVPVLAESWTSGLSLGADLLLGADSLPTSPLGRQYQDVEAVLGFGPVTLMSGLADATTPGLADLLASRQAVTLGRRSLALRRHAIAPLLSDRRSAVVLGSKPSGLPPGLALHAELLALRAAGLGGDQVLKSAGTNAAAALHLSGQIGLISPGALADLVLVSGDPLHQVSDALNVVAVVRNGRFFSLSSLLERADRGNNVE
jgi:hypothetical protein